MTKADFVKSTRTQIFPILFSSALTDPLMEKLTLITGLIQNIELVSTLMSLRDIILQPWENP